jgi:hypothetical protein
MGAVLGLGGILLFVSLWIVLGNWGMDQFQRLIITACLPPALIALLIGGYLLLQPKNRV